MAVPVGYRHYAALDRFLSRWIGLGGGFSEFGEFDGDGGGIEAGGGAGGYDPVASPAFGAVEGLVGEFDEFMRAFAALGRDGGAADGDGHDAGGVAFVGQAAVADGDTDVFGDCAGSVFVGAGQDDGEFFSAVAGDQVAGAEDDIECGFGDLFEAAVAADVAVGVVVALEVVGVDEQEGEFAAFAEGAAPFDGHGFVEAAAVGDAGEGVDDDQGFHGAVGGLDVFFGAFAFADVADQVEEADGAAGGGIAVDAEAALGPEVVSIFFAIAVFEGSAFGAGAEGAHGHFDFGEVGGVDQVAEESADQFIGLPSGEGADAGGDVGAAAVEIAEDDDVAGVVGYEFVEGGDLAEFALDFAQVSEDDGDGVEGEHGGDEVELEEGGSPLSVDAAGEGEGAVIMDGAEAADDGDHEDGECSPAEVGLGDDQDQEGEDEEEQGQAALREDEDGDQEDEDQVHPFFAQQVGIAQAAPQDGGEGGGDDGDAQAVPEEPGEHDVEKVAVDEDVLEETVGGAGDGGSEQAGEGEEAKQVAAVGEGRQFSGTALEEHGADEDFNHVKQVEEEG